MILEGFGKAINNDGKEYTFDILEDNIREINITDELVEGYRENGRPIAWRNDGSIYNLFLLNNEGKTLKTIWKNK